MSNVADLDAGFLDDILEWLLGASNEVFCHRLELCTGEGLIEVGWAVLGQREVRQLNAGAHGGAELLLCLLSSFLQTLQSDLVLGHVNTGGLLELLDQVLHDALIPVVTTEAVVTGGCSNLDG